MSSIKNILLTIAVIAILGVEIAYLMTVYRTEQETIAANREEIHLTELRIAELDKRIDQLPETEKELELVSSQKQAILNMLPSYTAVSKNTVELFRYMDLNDFVETGYKTLEAEGNQEEEDGIKRYNYQLSFVGRYEEAIEFVNNLNQSYQVTNVQNLIIENSVQDLENEDNWVYLAYYGEDFPQIVRATIDITMYAREDEAVEEQEIYQPDLELSSNPESLFAFIQSEDLEKPSTLEEEEEDEEETVPKIDITPIEDTDDAFTLSVGDRITSGDTYKLDGPGSDMDDYIGMITSTNVEISIDVYEDHYKMSMNDTNGEKEETEVQIDISEPRLNIISTMRALDDVMPNVHVYVNNHTSKVMKVALTGSLLENIYVFNGQGERITKGETKGNIKLT